VIFRPITVKCANRVHGIGVVFVAIQRERQDCVRFFVGNRERVALTNLHLSGF
jgi:hypothetical protein